MANKFNPSNLVKLDNPRRRALLPPEETLQKLGVIRSGTVLADVGCGSGYFTVPAALMTGPAGIVYAIDIAPEALAMVGERASEQGITNLVPLRSSEDTVPLPDQAVEGVLMVHVVHELADPSAYLREVNRILVPGGKVAVVEWSEQRGDWGPPESERVARNELAGMLSRANLYPEQIMDLNSDFYAIVANKEKKGSCV